MKKLISLLLSISTLFISCSTAFATQIGTVIGTAYNTDIVAYINNYAIPSYAVNGTSVIVAEDLLNFGFNVVWDQNARSLTITRGTDLYPKGMEVSKADAAPGSKFTDILYTDIVVFANGIRVPSYALNGYTMIPIESLTMLGTCNWVPAERAIKLWVDGLHIRSTMQPVAQYGTYTQSGDAFSALKNELMWKCEIDGDGDYTLFDYPVDDFPTFIYYDPSDNTISFLATVTTDDDIEISTEIVLSPNSSYFDYYFAIEGIAGYGYMKKSSISEYTTSVNFTEMAYDITPELKSQFCEVGALYLKLLTLAADIVLEQNGYSVDVYDLGFTNF